MPRTPPHIGSWTPPASTPGKRRFITNGPSRPTLPMPLLPCYLLLLLLLASYNASSQTTSAKPVCFSTPDAQRLLDSLRRLPTVRREAREWRLAYAKAHEAAVQDSVAAQRYHSALLNSQLAFTSQQQLLSEQRAETQKFKVRAHRKGWVLTALLVGIGLVIYLH